MSRPWQSCSGWDGGGPDTAHEGQRRRLSRSGPGSLHVAPPRSVGGRSQAWEFRVQAAHRDEHPQTFLQKLGLQAGPLVLRRTDQVVLPRSPRPGLCPPPPPGLHPLASLDRPLLRSRRSTVARTGRVPRARAGPGHRCPSAGWEDSCAPAEPPAPS